MVEFGEVAHEPRWHRRLRWRYVMFWWAVAVWRGTPHVGPRAEPAWHRQVRQLVRVEAQAAGWSDFSVDTKKSWRVNWRPIVQVVWTFLVIQALLLIVEWGVWVFVWRP